MWNVLEGHGMYYIILHHTRVVWSIRHGSSIWTVVEHFRWFWMVVQGKKKW